MDNYLAFVLSAFITSGLLEVSRRLSDPTISPTCFSKSVAVLSLFFFFQRHTFSPPRLSLQGLVEVVTSSDDQLAVRATILLGELLHMVTIKHFYLFLVFFFFFSHPEIKPMED